MTFLLTENRRSRDRRRAGDDVRSACPYHSTWCGGVEGLRVRQAGSPHDPGRVRRPCGMRDTTGAGVRECVYPPVTSSRHTLFGCAPEAQPRTVDGVGATMGER